MNLKKIFDHQRVLIDKFHDIERRNGLLVYDGPIPYDLTDIKAQIQLRRTAFDLFEEVGELVDASTQTDQWGELADIAHFVVELMICSGQVTCVLRPYEAELPSDRVTLPYSKIDVIHDFQFSLASAMHCLRAKPWKIRIKPNEPEYPQLIRLMFYNFLKLCFAYDMDYVTLEKYYFDKNEINHARIDAQN